jgi:hypothetical protein
MAKSACEILKERLIQGGKQESLIDKERRRAVLAWVESLRSSPNQRLAWESKPALIDDAHWHDLHSGALFFSAREAAIIVLDQLETHIGNQMEQRCSLDEPIPAVRPAIQSLRVHAQAFLNQQHADELATAFCRECVNDGDAALLASLVKRDDRVLRLLGRVVLPGPAFRGKSIQEPDADQPTAEGVVETSATDTIAWPEGISHRVRNLFLLNADLHGELSKWLGETTTASAGDEQ